MYVAQCLQGHRVLVQAGLEHGQRRRVPWGTRTVVLLNEYCDGLYLYLCELFLEIHEPDGFSRPDWHYRLRGGYPRRTDDFPCRFFRGRESRQRTLADLHHPAECVPTGLQQCTGSGVCHLTAVLSAPVVGGTDITDVAP